MRGCFANLLIVISFSGPCAIAAAAFTMIGRRAEWLEVEKQVTGYQLSLNYELPSTARFACEAKPASRSASPPSLQRLAAGKLGCTPEFGECRNERRDGSKPAACCHAKRHLPRRRNTKY